MVATHSAVKKTEVMKCSKRMDRSGKYYLKLGTQTQKDANSLFYEYLNF